MERRRFLLRTCVLAVAGVAGLGLASDGPAYAQRGPKPGNWEALGTQRVGFLTDRDVIRVGRQDGRFKSIKLKVRDNDIEIVDLKVVYGNGQTDDFPVRQKIRRGTETRAIDLKGNTRFIREVQMVYRSRPSFRGQALVELYGRN